MILLGAVAALACAPATSLAATLTQAGGETTYTAGAGETNDLTVTLSGGVYTFTDPGATISASAPCLPAPPNSATCPQPASSPDHLTILAGDMNDVVDLSALAGADLPRDGTRIDGANGADRIVGSEAADKITGGNGDDVVDPNDVTTPVNMDFFNSEPGLACDPDFTDTTMAFCPDIVDGEAGFNTLRFDHQARVVIDAGAKGSDPESVIDPARARNGDQRSNLLATKGRGWRFNRLVGTPGNDEIIGGQFADTLVGRGGADLLCGGFGNDTVDYSGSGEAVNVNLNTNLPADERWTSTDPQQFTIARADCRQTNSFGTVDPTKTEKDCIADDGSEADGPPGARDCVGVDTENVIGTPFADILTGNGPGEFVDKAAFFEPRGMNILDGRGGDDVLDGGLGADSLIGGDGFDTVSYANETQSVAVTIDGAANDGSAADLNPDSGKSDSVGTDVEKVVGGQGNDVLGGSAADEQFDGGPGDDLIEGAGGSDGIAGGDGADYLQGGDGNDQLAGGGGNDLLDGGTGADGLSGGGDSDAVDYSANTTPVVSTPDGAPNDGNNGGAEGDNVGGDVESAYGGSGNDTLVANDGGGMLDGGDGNDTLASGAGSDLIAGGAGLDNVSYAGRGASVAVDLAAGTGGSAGEADVIQGVEEATGGSGNDSIAGTDAVNLLFGGPGDDTISGRAGSDQLFGGPGNDTLLGDADNDTIAGEEGDDNLQGGTETDGLNGGDGNDQLDGGSGADIFTGGPGNDTALYASRSAKVDATFDGADNDGENGERDQIRSTVESIRTGSGNDSIDVRDGVAGNVDCGAGTDAVLADKTDTVANDCEERSTVGALSVCRIRQNSVTTGRRAKIRLRVTCPSSGKGTLRLRTVGRAKRAKQLGRASLSLRAGKSKRVTVKLNKRAKRLLRRHKGSLRAHVTISLKRAATASRAKRSKNVTIVAPRWRR